MGAGSNRWKVGDTVCGPNGDTGRHVRMGLDHILSILMPDPIFMTPFLCPHLLTRLPCSWAKGLVFSPQDFNEGSQV